MAEHRFEIGQGVYYRPKRSRSALHATVGPYQITKRVPSTGGEFKYTIRSPNEDYERIAKESELTRLEDRAPLSRRRPEIS
jgi:hypothetical protein